MSILQDLLMRIDDNIHWPGAAACSATCSAAGSVQSFLRRIHWSVQCIHSDEGSIGRSIEFLGQSVGLWRSPDFFNGPFVAHMTIILACVWCECGAMLLYSFFIKPNPGTPPPSCLHEPRHTASAYIRFRISIRIIWYLWDCSWESKKSFAPWFINFVLWACSQ